MSIGFKIKKLREEKNMSQPELAHKLAISQSKLSKIENGKINKEIDFLLMDSVCKEFDKDFECFLEGKTVNNIEKVENCNISCKNGTINNHYPENILEQVRCLIEENEILKRKIKG